MVDAQSQVFVSKSVSSRIYILLFIDLCIFNDLKSFKIEFNLYSFFSLVQCAIPLGCCDAPICSRHCSRIKDELEDAAFEILHPEEFIAL